MKKTLSVALAILLACSILIIGATAAGTSKTYKVEAGIDGMSGEPLDAYELTLSNVLSEPTKKIIQYRDWEADVFNEVYEDFEITVITLDPTCTITASNGSLYFATTILEDDSHVASGGYVGMDNGVTIDELVKYTSDNQNDGRIYLFTPMGANVEGYNTPFYFMIGTGAGSTAKPATSFTDVASGAYYADAVKWAVDKKITSGTTATTFSPNTTCSNGQILTFMWRANGQLESTIANPFTDVKDSNYFYQAALWASEKGLMAGTTLGADAPCTRSMVVTYLWKLAGQPSATNATSFTDVDSNADYAKAVAWAVEQGITSGTSATTFAPDTTCTRGQIVTFLFRAMSKA